MLSNEGWECPLVEKGDTVDVARNPESMAGSSPGMVTAVYTTPEGITSLDVLVTKGGGHRLYRAVHHVDDPALKEYPHWLKEPESGVFVIAKSTQRVRDLLATVNYLKGAINKLVSRVDQLEGSNPASNRVTTQPVKRGPGRPKKVPTELVGAAE